MHSCGADGAKSTSSVSIVRIMTCTVYGLDKRERCPFCRNHVLDSSVQDWPASTRWLLPADGRPPQNMLCKLLREAVQPAGALFGTSCEPAAACLSRASACFTVTAFLLGAPLFGLTCKPPPTARQPSAETAPLRRSNGSGQR